MFPTNWPVTYVTSRRHVLLPGNTDTPLHSVSQELCEGGSLRDHVMLQMNRYNKVRIARYALG